MGITIKTILDFQKDIEAKAKVSNIPGMRWDDVAQEIRLHLLKKADKYDPTRGASQRTFVNRVITNKIRDLVRAAKAQKRYADNYSFSLEELGEQESKIEEDFIDT